MTQAHSTQAQAQHTGTGTGTGTSTQAQAQAQHTGTEKNGGITMTQDTMEYLQSQAIIAIHEDTQVTRKNYYQIKYDELFQVWYDDEYFNDEKNDVMDYMELHIACTEKMFNFSRMIAIKALKMIYSKSADDVILKLLYCLQSKSEYGHVDGEDISSVVIMELQKSFVNGIDSNDAIRNMFKAVSSTIYSHRKNHTQLKHTFVRDYHVDIDDEMDTIEDIKMLSMSETKTGIDTIEDSIALKQLIDSLKLNPTCNKIVMLLIQGFTQVEIAEKLNVNQSTISRNMDKIKSSIPKNLLIDLMK